MTLYKKNITFSGRFPQKRSFWQAQCLRVGANFQTCFTKKTDIVVVGDKPCSKLYFAQQHQKQIFSPAMACEAFQKSKTVECKLPVWQNGRLKFDPDSIYHMKRFAQGSSRALKPTVFQADKEMHNHLDFVWQQTYSKDAYSLPIAVYNIKSNLSGEARIWDKGVFFRTRSRWTGDYLQKVYDWLWDEWAKEQDFIFKLFCTNFSLVQNSKFLEQADWKKPALHPPNLSDFV